MLIAHLSDLHVRPPGLPAYRVAETNRMTARAIDAVRALDPAPDCVLITGDLTDNGLDAEYANLVALLGRLRMPVYAVPGNHDRREPFRRHLAGRYGTLGADGFVDYAIEGHPVRLVALDTVIPGAGAGALDAARLARLDATLGAARDRPTVVFMHHPPFDCGIAHMDAIRLLEGAAAMEAIVARHPQVERVLCGHHHRPIHRRWAGTIASTAPSVAHQVELGLGPDDRAALVLEPPAYQIHLWDGSALVTHQALVQRFDGPYPFIADPDYPGR